MDVSTQIAVRLPDELVAWIDAQVAAGAVSRASITAKALQRYRREVEAERDAEIYRTSGGYPDLDAMHTWLDEHDSAADLD